MSDSYALYGALTRIESSAIVGSPLMPLALGTWQVACEVLGVGKRSREAKNAFAFFLSILFAHRRAS
jgi:hypothetical protein